MSLLFMDGCDLYKTDGSATEVNRRWRETLSGKVALAKGRFGGDAIQMVSGSGGFFSAVAPVPVGSPVYFAAHFDPNGTGGLSKGIISFRDRGNVQGARIDTGTVAGDELKFRFVGGAFNVTASGALNNAYNLVELAFVPANTGGSIKVRVNHVTVIDEFGDTWGGTDTTELMYFELRGFFLSYWDDVVIWDSVGDPPNTWPLDASNDHRIQTLDVTADATVQMTPLAGPNNWDELQTMDDDTTYVEGTAGQKDIYDMEAMSVPNKIHVVQTVAVAKKTAAKYRGIQVGAQWGTNESISRARPLEDEYLQAIQYWGQHPVTGAAITKADVDALQPTIKTV